MYSINKQGYIAFCVLCLCFRLCYPFLTLLFLFVVYGSNIILPDSGSFLAMSILACGIIAFHFTQTICTYDDSDDNDAAKEREALLVRTPLSSVAFAHARSRKLAAMKPNVVTVAWVMLAVICAVLWWLHENSGGDVIEPTIAPTATP